MNILENARSAVKEAKHWLLDTTTQKEFSREVVETYLNMIENSLKDKKTFDELYPNKKIIQFEGTDLIKVKEKRPCLNCGSFTQWVDMNFMGHLCSDECARTKWNEFEKAKNT